MSWQHLMSYQDGNRLICLFVLFYILATPKVFQHGTPICDSTHSWRLYSAAPLWDQAISTMWPDRPTQSHYPDTESTSPNPNLIMPSIWLWSIKYQFWLTKDLNLCLSIFRSPKTRDARSTHSVILSGPCQHEDRRCLLFYALATSKVISRRVQSTWLGSGK